MKILLSDNTVMDLGGTPELGSHYYVLDYTLPDMIMLPLIYIEEYSRPICALTIGKYHLEVPLDWSIMIADQHCNTVDMLELKHLNDREFDAFVINPLSYRPSYLSITVENVFPDTRWITPVLKKGHIWMIPLSDEEKPLCAFFCKTVTKAFDDFDLSDLL